MSLRNKLELAAYSRSSAEKYFYEENYGKAYAHLLVVLELVPNIKKQLERFFISVLSLWCKKLEDLQRYSDVFLCYKQAIDHFPESEILLNNLGLVLFRLKHYEEARLKFSLAWYLHQNFLAALKNLENTSNYLVERWHFRMLNDTHRNNAYRKAIYKKIQLGFDSVLDIGTGTGLLSLYAKDGGAKQIYACDYSEIMINISEKVIESNCCTNKIKLINKLSNELKIPEDIPSRVSLVITETLDSGLLGEHILQTIIHAWEYLLLPRSGMDNKLIKRVLPERARIFLVPIECSHFRKESRVSAIQENVLKINLCDFELNSSKEEPYDTENLKPLFKSLSLLAKAQEVFTFDFNDSNSLKKFIEKKGVSKLLRFECIENGLVDALVMWFELDLDEDITLSSSPFNDYDSCWEQAVFYVKNKTEVLKGELLDVDVSCKDEILHAKIISKSTKTINTKTIFNLSKSSIRFLNDIRHLKAILELKDNVLNKACKDSEILDLSPVPLLGLTFSKLHFSKITWFYENNQDARFIKDILEKNGLSELATCLPKSDMENHFFKDQKSYDVIYVNLFERCGEISEELLSNISLYRSRLKPGGNLLPKEFTIWCQVVQSDWLTKRMVIMNQELNNLNVAQFINDYKVYHCQDIDLNVLPFTSLSAKLPIANIQLDKLDSSESMTFSFDLEIKKEGIANVIIFWYTYELGKYIISTWDKNSHINQAAQILDQQIKVSVIDKAEIVLLFCQGFSFFSLKVKNLGTF